MNTQPQYLPAGTPGQSPTATGIEDLLSAFAAIADDLDLDAVLERVVSAACQLVDARFGALGVIGPDRMLGHFITVGLDDDEIGRIGPLPRGHGVLGLLITEPRPVRLADLRRHPLAYGFPAEHPQMTSFLGVPIRIHDRVFGNLYLTEKRGGADFSDADEQLVVALASAAGVAIENSRLFDESNRRTRWLEGGIDAARELLGRHTEADSDHELVARHALHASQSTLVVVLRDLGHHRGLICEAADGVEAATHLGRRARGGPLLHDLTGTSPPALITGPDVALVLPGAAAGTIDAALCSRLPGEREPHFLVIGRAPGATAFFDVDHEMMRSFTSHVSLALELLRAHRRREQEAVFGDRDRIARDLHDVVIQRLFAAGLSIQTLRKYTADARALDRISAVTTELDATIRELRDTIYSLRSVPQSAPSFTSTVFSLVADAFDGQDLEPVLHLSGPLDSLVEGERADHLRAVLREGLSNALRHADAQAITIALGVAGGQLDLSIDDDGRGFAEPVRASGLANMRRRAELCGGTISITSTPGCGTRIHLVMPVDIRRTESAQGGR
ncbi:GAF domain-containing protein [Arthrobacter sp. B0490]|uniref:GAF domain-containing sensor histidine kinase n=1 Tax=Arthrobacter sp. B0490 TaxID=2058891 RepID=UPI0015E3EF79|nr:GAF domain-containing protein [Arthrobacter sp. B0490]